ncbi:MAG TPA: hypothetical protein DIS74_01035 [Bacteroidales bacterium]|nr:hypothetical protein [Bacteroidales bacterium]
MFYPWLVSFVLWQGMSDFFKNNGFLSAGFINLSSREAYAEAMHGNAVIVDVSEDRLTGYKNFDVPWLIHLPKNRLAQEYADLPFDMALIIADSVGLRSHEAMEFMLGKGFENISNLAGGIVEWEQDGLPIKIDDTEQLSGSCVCQLRPRNKT